MVQDDKTLAGNRAQVDIVEANKQLLPLAGTGSQVNVDKATASCTKSLAGTGSRVNVDGVCQLLCPLVGTGSQVNVVVVLPTIW